MTKIKTNDILIVQKVVLSEFKKRGLIHFLNTRTKDMFKLSSETNNIKVGDNLKVEITKAKPEYDLKEQIFFNFMDNSKRYLKLG